MWKGNEIVNPCIVYCWQIIFLLLLFIVVVFFSCHVIAKLNHSLTHRVWTPTTGLLRNQSQQQIMAKIIQIAFPQWFKVSLKKTFINVINSFLTFLLEFYKRCYYLLVFVIIILMKMQILFTWQKGPPESTFCYTWALFWVM